MVGVRLPLDVPLCDGNGEPACETCARRLADREPAVRWWIEPTADGVECALHIETLCTITAKGREMLRGK